jgi:hypothetical protein
MNQEDFNKLMYRLEVYKAFKNRIIRNTRSVKNPNPHNCSNSGCYSWGKGCNHDRFAECGCVAKFDYFTVYEMDDGKTFSYCGNYKECHKCRELVDKSGEILPYEYDILKTRESLK